MSGPLVEQLERIGRELGGTADMTIQLERPRNPEHGDLATNLALLLGPRLHLPPRDIARQVIDRLALDEAGVASAEIAGPGFINFRFVSGRLQARLREVFEADQAFGRSAVTHRGRVQVEFVSANPTGPLHVAHGRGAALGDAIASLLEWTGHDVTREFYVNDAGTQIDRLAESLEARWLEGRGREATIPEGGYHGEYLREMAAELDRTRGDELDAMQSAERRAWLRSWAIDRLLEEQERDLQDFRVHFDVFYRESRLYEEQLLERTLQDLDAKGLTYRSEGATWLRTTDFGDDKDRVLVKGDGTFTYFLPDLAYHRDKAQRGFERVIDVWGADHHGYAPRMRGALAAMGLGDMLDVEIVQMVRIMRGGQETKLSKRAGQYVTLRELFTETGVDVARYFFLMRRGDTQMLFDLDLALDHSEKNPVFKVQYAHARMMSIFRKAAVDAAGLVDAAPLEALTAPAEVELIKQLLEFPEVVTRAAESRAPHILCDYLETTAGQVNSWYHAGNPSRNPDLAVLVDDPLLRAARLALARAIRIVLRNGLTLLGLDAPDRMDRAEAA